MKNRNIKPGDIVPKEIYEKAIKLIKKGKPIAQLNSFSLCLTLPCILWELNCFLDDSPNGRGYDSSDAITMFPEFTQYRLNSINSFHGSEEKKDIQRIKVLTEMLAEL